MKRLITIPALGLIWGIGSGILFLQFLPDNDELFGGMGFLVACYQLPGLYFLLGILLALVSPKINLWLHGMILGAVFSLPALLFIFWEFGGFPIRVIALWALLFVLSGSVAGWLLTAAMKLFRFHAIPAPAGGKPGKNHANA